MQNQNGFKDICLPIHGHISLHPLCVAIIDTPQFQRLRNIMQLGTTSFVYPGGTHSRFEHSLGVAHLARLFVESLRKHQTGLGISDEDMLCVEVAGLCHDLGHGPFSHFWEEFLNSSPADTSLRQEPWKHEMASCKMLDYLIQSNGLMSSFEEWNIAGRIDFIKDLIRGKTIKELRSEEEKAKYYLYEIVNNTESGLDVDKWDYLLRDTHHTGLPAHFCYKRIMEHARVISENGVGRICFRDKTAYEIYSVFHTRNTLYKAVYKHKVIGIIDSMMREAIRLANNSITGPDGCPLDFCAITRDFKMDKFSTLNDSLVFSWILNSTDINEGAVGARKILNDILCRRLYSCVVDEIIGFKERLDAAGLKSLEEEILNEIVKPENGEPVVRREDVAVHFLNIHWGKCHEDPVAKVPFFSKRDRTKLFYQPCDKVLASLPARFQELHVHVYCKRKDRELHVAIRNRADRVIQPNREF